MGRVAIFLFILFALLFLARVLRLLILAFRTPAGGRSSGSDHQEMVRDPVCGTWIDRRLAIAGRRGTDWVPVCSEKCRTLLEAPASRA